jgi:serine/threonine protein phosphatase 1
VIGDIHGMLRPLRTVLDAVYARDPQPRLYFVGDYVNRGPHSRGVIDLLLTLDDARFVRGNHDDVFDAVLHGESYSGESTDGHRIAAFRWFMQHGLDMTFLSYNASEEQLEEALRRPSIPALEALAGLVPAEHKRFIRDLPPTIEEPDLFVAHAKWELDLPADSIASRAGASDKLRYGLLWGRFTAAEIERKKRWRARGFFGHTPVANYAADEDDDEAVLPIVRDDIVLLDTGAVLTLTGRLSAVCAETDGIVQSDRMGNLVPANAPGGN